MFRFFKKKQRKHFSNKCGVFVVKPNNNIKYIDWSKINKVVFVKNFTEYSGYFLTAEYKNKELYQSIYIDCSENLVRRRNHNSSKVMKNVSDPFLISHGETTMEHCYFVEYLDSLGQKNLYVSHYKKEREDMYISTLREYLVIEQIEKTDQLQGFHEL